MTILRVGVTGHRALASPGLAAQDVDAVLDRLQAEAGDVDFICISSLAEGADRIVAEQVLERPGGRLEAVLPLEPADYEADFASAVSREAFNDLLLAADRIIVVPPDPADDSREGAYWRAGSAMLLASDVVIALWDGEPAQGRGGTAEVIEEAERLGIPVEVVTVERASA